MDTPSEPARPAATTPDSLVDQAFEKEMGLITECREKYPSLLEGKDGDMWHTGKVLSREFRKDIVNVGRDRRFWVTRLREWRMAMMDGHDTTYGHVGPG